MQYDYMHQEWSPRQYCLLCTGATCSARDLGGCPKLAVEKLWGIQIFKGDNILNIPWELYWGENYSIMGLKLTFLEIHHNFWGRVLTPKGWFLRVWVSKRRPDALLAKTVLCSSDIQQGSPLQRLSLEVHRDAVTFSQVFVDFVCCKDTVDW